MSSRRGGGGSVGGAHFRAKKSREAALSPLDTTLIAVSYLLDSKLFLKDVPLKADHSSGIVIEREELPTPSGDANGNKFRSLFRKCLRKTKKDRIQFCSTCYSRASKDPTDRSWCVSTWQHLAGIARETSVEATLTFIIEDSDSGGGDSELIDLMSSLYGDNLGSGVSNPALVKYLERLCGWSPVEQRIPGLMVQQIMVLARQSPVAAAAVVKLVMTGCQEVCGIVKIDTILVEGRQVLESLDVLFDDVNVIEILADALLQEMETAESGESFMTKSVFSGLVRVTTMGDIHSMSHKDARYSCFVELNNFPKVSMVDANSCMSQLQDVYHHLHKLLHTVLMKIIKSDKGTRSKDIVLSWLSAVVSLNEVRAGPRFRKEKIHACSDGFMVNLCAVLLAFCKPLFSTHVGGPKLSLISRDYPSSPVCRLDLVNETCLASGDISRNRTSEGNVRFRGLPCPGDDGLPAVSRFKFVTEIFFIMQRALHVGLLPAVQAYSSMVSDLAGEVQSDNPDEKIQVLFSLYQLSWSSCLLDPQLVQMCCEFYITQAVWITKILQDCRQEGLSEEEIGVRQRRQLSGLPESCVKDMALWFRFVVAHRPALLQGLQLTPMVDCCVALLERPDLLPHPLSQSRIVSTLLVFINSDKMMTKALGNRSQQLLGPSTSWSGFLGELSIMVQGNPTVREHLGPALLHTYVAVGVFEGLDVDKENFDKFSTRYEVTQLLLRLWSRRDCRESILEECGSNKFQLFLGAVFDTLLYQLNDALSRLGNVRLCEQAIDNGEWTRLSHIEKVQKEMFFKQQKRASRGFMTQASLQLELLLEMSQDPRVARCLSLAPLGRRTAAALLGFLNALCGSKSSNLNVKDKDKYAFDPVNLVSSIASILIQVYEQNGKGSSPGSGESIASCMADHPDFSEAAMGKCLSVLQKNPSSVGLCASFEGFMKQVLELHATPASPHPAGADGSYASDAANTSWQEDADSSMIDEEGFQEIYVESLEDSKFDGAELEDCHVLAAKAQTTLDPRSPMARAVLRDMKQLQEAHLIHPDSSVFVRQDEDHLDLVRVLITGPTGTPYSRGCFVFDVNYPASYPNNPPLVVITTTAGGTVRFNPNLYEDGKVCLSLLGTWHGGDATEKWDPAHSSLSQVILSIQGLILIPDPTFNEPGYEAIRGTAEGNKQNREYNADIQVYTIRYAMTEQLRNPPEGLKDVIQVHFALQRDYILKQCSKWLKEAISDEHRKKLLKAIDELRLEIDRL